MALSKENLIDLNNLANKMFDSEIFEQKKITKMYFSLNLTEKKIFIYNLILL